MQSAEKDTAAHSIDRCVSNTCSIVIFEAAEHLVYLQEQNKGRFFVLQLGRSDHELRRSLLIA